MLISLRSWDKFLCVNQEPNGQLWFMPSLVDKPPSHDLYDYSPLEFLQLWKPPMEVKSH